MQTYIAKILLLSVATASMLGAANHVLAQPVQYQPSPYQPQVQADPGWRRDASQVIVERDGWQRFEAPPPRYEAVPPPPRSGYSWQRGYWERRHQDAPRWVKGYWVAVQPVAVVAPPAPPPAAPQYQRPKIERISADALFRFDQSSLGQMLPAGRAQLAAMAKRLAASRFARVEVRGYTDRLGTDSYNLNLSIQRANTVKDVLVSYGIPAGRIKAVGLGAQDAVIQCSDGLPQQALIRCLLPNRRVEIATFAMP
ncbi:outer membrane protein OmpA-like peptidoglycan-associated protein [Collimonas sp. PA-H2]|uniref:OmpA family protein n=1 Tax=Collimonas sp. PA-H2 TaxID=1881062 RepID=UPI000BF79A0B|nr:OmpA family protein [Collimonas sp. PA-H2]PFH09635.1 outer membrane protein OmpA-like peptidoglycan-associated protein [Collimonas sp. PA-H2]